MEATMGGLGASGRRAGLDDVPSMGELKAVEENGPELDRRGANGVGPTHTFEFDHVDRRKRRWTGSFTVRALTTRDKINVGLTRARLANGVSPAMLDANTLQLLEMLAHLSIAITDAPDWANDLSKIMDEWVVVKLYEEVVNYEQRFHGAADDDAGDNPGPGSDG